MARRLACLPAILLAAMLAPPAAMAATEEVEVPVTVRPLEGKTQPSQCFVWIVAEWKDPEGATGWKLEFKRKGVAQSKGVRPPFDDEFLAKYGLRPSGDAHWARITYFARDAPGRVPSCAGKAAELMSAYSDFTMTVTVKKKTTIEGVVKDTDGDPVSGANIKVAGVGSDRTDDEGYYEVELPDRDRTYRVTPSHSAAERFTPKRRTVRVKKGQTKKANFKMKAQRTIEGRVGLACSGSSCSRAGVFGVKIKARGGRSYADETDAKGEYKLHVRKGRYRVTADAGPMTASPSRRTVDVRKSRKRTADYKACLAGPSSSGKASAAAVTGGVWAQVKQESLRGVETCAEYIVLRWTPTRQLLTVTRYSVPLCSTANNPQPTYDVTRAQYVYREARVDTGQGHALVASPGRVDFVFGNPTELMRGAFNDEGGGVRLPGWFRTIGGGKCEGKAYDRIGVVKYKNDPNAVLDFLPKGP